MQLSTLLSIKTGGCPQACSCCPQSAHYETGVDEKSLMDVAEVLAAACPAATTAAWAG